MSDSSSSHHLAQLTNTSTPLKVLYHNQLNHPYSTMDSPASPPRHPHHPDASFATAPDDTNDQDDLPEDYSFNSEAPSVPYDAEDVEADLTQLSASSPGSRSVDSLADADYEQVELRALEFLAAHSSPPLSDDAPLPAFDNLANFPTKLPNHAGEQATAHAKAIQFLRQKLDETDADDWRYTTPAVFGPPPALGLRSEREGGVAGDEEAGAGDQPWVDSAFNLERHQVEGIPDQEVWLHEDPMVDHRAARFGDAVGVDGWEG